MIRKFFGRFGSRPTIDDFAEGLIRGMKAAGESVELHYLRDEGRILRVDDGKPAGVINLGNMFPTYLATPRKGRDDYLKTCIRSALLQHREMPAEFEDARADLRPRAWSRLAMEKVRLRSLIGEVGPDVANMPSIPIGEHIVATLAYDWPEAVQSVNQANLDAWGVSLYEAMEAAMENLRQATEGYARIGDGFYSFISGDSYDATRLLLVDYIGRMEVKGSHVALAAGRDQLMVTGSEDEEGLAMMADLAVSCLSEPYALSGSLLILEGGEWRDWLPSGPLHRKFLDIRTNWLGPEYSEQKGLIDALHARQGIDTFVASLSAVKRDDGGMTTYCVWGEGVESLLPEADKVVFMDASQVIVALAGWDRARDLAGHLMETAEFYPPRWLVKVFPGEDVIGSLGMAEL